MVGTLSGAEIDILRLREQLSPTGGNAPRALIWSGAVDLTPACEAAFPDLKHGDAKTGRTLLESLMLKCHDPAFRKEIRTACQNYTADIERADASSERVTMNWSAFDAGDRVRSQPLYDPLQVSQETVKARTRLSKLADALSPCDANFLRQLVLFDATRSVLARKFEMRPALAERHGLSLLRVLVELYRANFNMAN